MTEKKSPARKSRKQSNQAPDGEPSSVAPARKPRAPKKTPPPAASADEVAALSPGEQPAPAVAPVAAPGEQPAPAVASVAAPAAAPPAAAPTDPGAALRQQTAALQMRNVRSMLKELWPEQAASLDSAPDADLLVIAGFCRRAHERAIESLFALNPALRQFVEAQ